ncbi:MAG: hypothetical protein CMJ17_00325 [Phenylobacterium sp.]|jgi:predicted 2-oxoglutarate/Fe(II)-dependent dioxygenase YbiX|nr:hypothetical protein [Phenylobacterium sp.]
MRHIMETPIFVGHKALDTKLVDMFIEKGKELVIQEAVVNQEDSVLKDNSYRQTDVGFFPKGHMVETIIKALVTNVNDISYKCEITDAENIQFGIYREGYFYKPHRDFDPSCPNVRKLSVTVQLSDSHHYEGGDFRLWDFFGNEVADPKWRDKGTILIFPSCLKHEVTPVTKGTRMSLVQWYIGPEWR